MYVRMYVCVYNLFKYVGEIIKMPHHIYKIYKIFNYWSTPKTQTLSEQTYSQEPHCVHSVHPPLLSAGRGGWGSEQIFKKGGLAGSQSLEGGCWEWVTFFRGVAVLHKK